MAKIEQLVKASSIDDDTTVFEGIKPIVEIAEELESTNIIGKLSFTSGITLSNILNKVQQRILERGGLNEDEMEDTDIIEEIGEVLSSGEKDFLYGIYLIS